MRKLLAIAAAAVLIPASAFAQSPTYVPDQHGAVGSLVTATDPGGNSRKVALPLVQNGGVSSALNISASTLVAAGAHRVATVCVITAGSTAGTLNDSATTGGAATANEVYPIPNTLGCSPVNWPIFNGIVVVPGTGQVVALSYN